MLQSAGDGGSGETSGAMGIMGELSRDRGMPAGEAEEERRSMSVLWFFVGAVVGGCFTLVIYACVIAGRNRDFECPMCEDCPDNCPIEKEEVGE